MKLIKVAWKVLTMIRPKKSRVEIFGHVSEYEEQSRFCSNIPSNQDEDIGSLRMDGQRRLSTRKSIQLLGHPPYSPDMASCNLWVRASIKGILLGNDLTMKGTSKEQYKGGSPASC